MENIIKNIFITGKPGCGKTTLIREILKELNLEASGFYTSEIREKGERVGFKINTLDGREGILAHQNIKSPYQVSKYGVNIKDLEEIGVKTIEEGLKENCLIVVDELGKIELFSDKFKKAVETVLDSKNKVLGTIKLTSDPFTNKIKNREDTKIFYLIRRNKEKIKKEIIKLMVSS